MTTYWQILGLIAPVLAIIGVGVLSRRYGLLRKEADVSLMRLVVDLFFPCLIFEAIMGNAAMTESSNILPPVLMGAGTILMGYLFGFWVGKGLGFSEGKGLRTFAFSVGIYNYGYIPIPLVEDLFGKEALGVLFVHNMGAMVVIWTVGVLILAGTSSREGLRKLINAPNISIILAISLNAMGVADYIPDFVHSVTIPLGACAVPAALLLVGATLEGYLGKIKEVFDWKVCTGATLLRLGLLPLIFLFLTKYLPLSEELKMVMVIESAMPAGIFPLVIARHYGGQPTMAAQVIISTTLMGLVIIPLWIEFGIWFIGL